MNIQLQGIAQSGVEPSRRGRLVYLSDVIYELAKATSNDDDGLEKARELLENLREMSDGRAISPNNC